MVLNPHARRKLSSPPNEELEQRAKLFGERATKLLEELKGAEGDTASKSTTALLYFLQMQQCYAELYRRRAIERADRDKKEAEERADQDRKRETRHFRIELFFTVVITALIGWEIHEGRQQAAVLQKMNKNTQDTALQIQRAADATTASLEILRQEQAEREKKPRLALYVGNMPIDKATIRPTIPNGPTQSIARLDLLLKNEGDAPLSASEIHALLPEDINIDMSPLPPVPEYEPSKPATRTISYAIPLMPVGKTLRISSAVFVPKGRASFRITFTLTTAQLQAMTPLGSLTVLSPKP